MAEDEARPSRPQARAQALGVTGERVSSNLAILRSAQGLSTTQLSVKLGELGRPIPPSGITKIEKQVRRVDADDLMALALALKVTPNRLLLPVPTDEGAVALTSTVEVDLEEAWHWACGDRPLPSTGETVRQRRARQAKFVADNRLPGPASDDVRRAVETLSGMRGQVAKTVRDTAEMVISFSESNGEAENGTAEGEDDGQGLD